MTLHDFKTEFDTLFINALRASIHIAKNTLEDHALSTSLDHILELAKKGKRIRPYNTALAYSLYCDKDWRLISDTLIGIELIHLMALVHDDIMDDSPIRHGVPSMHSFIEKALPTQSKTHIQVSTSEAVLVGDLLFAWAYASISKNHQTAESWNVIHQLVEEVILGQMIDVYSPLETSTTSKAVEKKMLLKTARYTFTQPLLLGALCAGTKSSETKWLTKFGDSIGLLFQMQDDLLDITGTVEHIKKEPLGDIKNGVHTLLSLYIVENANTEEKELWNTWFANTMLTLEDQKAICLFCEKIGVFNFSSSYIKTKEEEARAALFSSSLPESKKEYLTTLITNITTRTY